MPSAYALLRSKQLAGSKAAQALRMARKNKKLISQTEVKTFDKAIVSSGVSTATIVRLSTPITGDSYVNRDGLSVIQKSIELKGNVTVDASGVATIVRLILFSDHDNNGIPPAVTDVLKAGTVNSYRTAFPDTLARYKFLMDRKIHLSNTGPESRSIDFYKKLSGVQRYRGTTDADTSAGQGSLWLMYMSNEGTNLPVVTLESRFRFTG